MSQPWVLDRTINLTEAGALVVGLIALGFSLFNFWFLVGRDPRLATLPTRQILILSQDYPARGEAIARFAVNHQYINDRKFGAAAVVTEETLQVGFAEASHRYIWQATGNFKYEDGYLRHEEGQAPRPAVVKAGEAVGYEAYYAPATSEDALEWNGFLDDLESEGEMGFRFITEVHDQPTISRTCRVVATPRLLEVLRSRTWAAPPCQG